MWSLDVIFCNPEVADSNLQVKSKFVELIVELIVCVNSVRIQFYPEKHFRCHVGIQKTGLCSSKAGDFFVSDTQLSSCI